MKSLLVAVVTLLLAGCGHVIPGELTGGDPFDFAIEHQCEKAEDESKAQVMYLGSGGVYIAWGDDAILIGPSFSNHPLWRAIGGRVSFDMNRIESRMKHVPRDKVRAIFAGHSHYDHIGDIPKLGLRVPVYVNESGANMLAPYDLNVSTIAPGQWMPAGSIRVRAVESGHAPQILPCSRWPCVYAGGEVKETWTEPWERRFLQQFRGGQVYAFVIELLDGAGEARYRIYYNDAAAPSPLGQVVDDFDLAILTVAQWNWVRDYPRDLLLTLRPRHVLVSHWDDFMRKDEKTARFIPTMLKRDLVKFLGIVSEHVGSDDAGPSNNVCGVETKEWTMPVIGSSLLFEPR